MDGPLFPTDDAPDAPLPPPAPPSRGTSRGRRAGVVIAVVLVVAMLVSAVVYSATRPDVTSKALSDASKTREREREQAVAEAAEIAECEAQLRRLEVAVEAHVASTGEYPSTEVDLLHADLIRAFTSLYDVDDGYIRREPNSPCDEPDAQNVEPLPTTTVPRSTTSTSTTVEIDHAEATCAALAESIASVEAVPPDAGALAMIDAVARLKQDLVSARQDAPSAQERALDEFDEAMNEFVTTSQAALDAGAAANSPDVADAAEHLVIVMLDFAFDSYILATAFPEVGMACPDLIDDDLTIEQALQFSESLFALVSAMEVLDFLGHSEVNRAYLTEQEQAELTMTLDRNIGAPQSTYVGDYRECYFDLEAYFAGDNAACDTLMDACGEGDLLACNDLQRASMADSEYEIVGRTCGGRATSGDKAYGGSCDLLG